MPSPMVATILVLGIIVSGLAIAVVIILPYEERMTAESSLEAMKTGFKDLNREILSLVSKYSPTSHQTTEIKLAMRTGAINLVQSAIFTININNTQMIGTNNPITINRLRYSFSSDYEFLPVGTRKYLLGDRPYIPRPVCSSGLAGNLTLSSPLEGNYFLGLDYGLSVLWSFGIVGTPVANVTITGITLEGIHGGILGNDPILLLQVTKRATTTYSTLATSAANVSVAINGGQETCWNSNDRPKYIPFGVTTFDLTITLVTYTVSITEA